MNNKNENNKEEILCSECFSDIGLKLSAKKIGIQNDNICRNCKRNNGFKLDNYDIRKLLYNFFEFGSMVKTKYGGASKVYENQESDIEVSDALKKDIKLFEEKLGFCFKYYAPPLWKIGNTEIIESLENNKEKNKIFDRIVEEFPTIFLEKNEIFYRIRVNPEDPFDENQYDSSPKSDGRLNPENESVLYASKNLEICIY